MYTFIPKTEDEWDANKGTALGNLVGIGVTVAANSTVQHAIKLDPDFNFKLLWFKYTVYWYDSVTGLYMWYVPVTGWMLPHMNDQNNMIGTPLVRYINISVSFRPDSRYLYGDQNLDILTNGGTGQSRLQVQSVQGYEYGYGQVRDPYWLPNWGYIVFEITNTHTVKNLVVGGIACGLKVRL